MLDSLHLNRKHFIVIMDFSRSGMVVYFFRSLGAIRTWARFINRIRLSKNCPLLWYGANIPVRSPRIHSLSYTVPLPTHHIIWPPRRSETVTKGLWYNKPHASSTLLERHYLQFETCTQKYENIFFIVRRLTELVDIQLFA